MTAIWRDRLLFGVLFLIGVVWAYLSATTISAGYSGSSISPRSFPFALGLLLALLAVVGLVMAELGNRKEPDLSVIEAHDFRNEVWGVVATFGFLIIYVIAMQYLGFTLATVISVAAFTYFVLGQRSPISIGVLSLTLGLGVYLLMNKLLGVYLPTGVLGLGI